MNVNYIYSIYEGIIKNTISNLIPIEKLSSDDKIDLDEYIKSIAYAIMVQNKLDVEHLFEIPFIYKEDFENILLDNVYRDDIIDNRIYLHRNVEKHYNKNFSLDSFLLKYVFECKYITVQDKEVKYLMLQYGFVQKIGEFTKNLFNEVSYNIGI